MMKDEVLSGINKIASNYTVFQCVECAEDIKAWLKANGITGVHLQLTAVGRIKFIVSHRWKNGQESIAQTGIHQGIETLGQVFDNLPRMPMNRQDWIADFDCASGEFEIIELELF